MLKDFHLRCKGDYKNKNEAAKYFSSLLDKHLKKTSPIAYLLIIPSSVFFHHFK